MTRPNCCWGDDQDVDWPSLIVALVADVNYFLPLITAGGTVVAAIITGFAAASRKHKWDMQDDELRWERERAERRRDEVKSAFVSYLSARQRSRLLTLSFRKYNEKQLQNWIGESAHPFISAYYELLLVLPDQAHRQVLVNDYNSTEEWIESNTDGGPPENADLFIMAIQLLST